MESPRPHGNPTVLPPLKPISITANETGKSLSELLADGRISAIIGAARRPGAPPGRPVDDAEPVAFDDLFVPVRGRMSGAGG